MIRVEGDGGKEPEHYTMNDIYIGARVTINSHDFVLTGKTSLARSPPTSLARPLLTRTAPSLCNLSMTPPPPATPDAPIGTLRFMETHCVPSFPKSNIREITAKLMEWCVFTRGLSRAAC